MVFVSGSGRNLLTYFLGIGEPVKIELPILFYQNAA